MGKKSQAVIERDQRIRELQDECGLRDEVISSMARGERADVIVSWLDASGDENEI